MKLILVTNILTFLAISTLAEPVVRDNVFGQASAVVTSSNFESSSTNINGKVSTTGKLDSSIVKGSADVSGNLNSGKLKESNAKVEGASISSRFDSSDNDKGVVTNASVKKDFVQVKDPSNRKGYATNKVHTSGLATRFSADHEEYGPDGDSDEYPIRQSGITASDWSEARRILDEVLLLQLMNRLNTHGSGPRAQGYYSDYGN